MQTLFRHKLEKRFRFFAAPCLCQVTGIRAVQAQNTHQTMDSWICTPFLLREVFMEINDGQRMHSIQHTSTHNIASITRHVHSRGAISSGIFILHRYVCYLVLTLLFFLWGNFPLGRLSGRVTSCSPRHRRRQSSLPIQIIYMMTHYG